MSIAKHTVYIALGQVLPIAVSLATVPLYLHTIGLDRYGILSICWLVLGYFGLFDLGLGRAIAQKIASLRDAPHGERSQVFWTAIGMNAGLTVLACLLFVPLVIWGFDLLKFSSPEQKAELERAIPWLAAILPVALLGGVLTGALEGRERFGFLSSVNTLGSVAMSTLPLGTALLFGPDIRLLVAASLAARLLTMTLLFVGCWKFVPLSRPEGPDRRLLGKLLSYGGWITVSSVIGPLLYLWDRFVVGATLSASAVAVYVVPQNLTGYILIIPGALSGAMFPRFSAESGEDAARLARDALTFLTCLMTPLVIGAILVIGPFLHLWVGSKVAEQAAPLAYVLLIGTWANSLARVPLSRLQGQGRPDLAAKTHAAELVPYAVVLFAMVKAFGLVGVAISWTLRCVADTLVLIFLAERNRRPLQDLVPPFALVSLAAATAYALPFDQPIRWIVLMMILGVSVILAWRTMPANVRAQLLSVHARWNPIARGG